MAAHGFFDGLDIGPPTYLQIVPRAGGQRGDMAESDGLWCVGQDRAVGGRGSLRAKKSEDEPAKGCVKEGEDGGAREGKGRGDGAGKVAAVRCPRGLPRIG